MKKDWVRIDGNMNGQGRRNENISYELKLDQECSNQVEEINNYVLEHPECDYRINDGSCLSSKAVFKNQVRGKKRKKKKKRFRKLWDNCPVLRDFKGRLSISQEMVLDRRKKRYQEEHLIYHEHVLSTREKVISMKVKDGSLKSCYVEPNERRQADLSCESETQTLDQPPAVVASVGAAEQSVIINNYNGRQSAGDECTPILMVGTNSLDSVTDPKKVAEEEIIVTCFG
jgi:hypothetical protein